MVERTDDKDRLEALTTLRALLIEEREALASRDHPAILDCAERKAARAEELQALVPSLAALPAAGSAEHARLLDLARECDSLNRANGVTVAALRNVVDRALGILRGANAEEEPLVYGPSGTQHSATAGRYAGSA